MMQEKIQSFADGKYDLARTDMDAIYDEQLGDAAERIEALPVTQRTVSTGPFSSFAPAPFSHIADGNTRCCNQPR